MVVIVFSFVGSLKGTMTAVPFTPVNMRSCVFAFGMLRQVLTGETQLVISNKLVICLHGVICPCSMMLSRSLRMH